LLLSDGKQFVGADGYRYLMKRVWWAVPLYAISVLPVFRWLFDWSYRTFAKNRHRISRTCRIPARN
jgi:hypothetical protein